IILDGQADGSAMRRLDQGQNKTVFQLAAVAPAVTTNIPQYLVEMAPVEENLFLMPGQIHDEMTGRDFFYLTELAVEFVQKSIQGNQFLPRTIAPVQFQHVFDYQVHSGDIVFDDSQQAGAGRIRRVFLLQKLVCMADGAERIANFMG